MSRTAFERHLESRASVALKERRRVSRTTPIAERLGEKAVLGAGGCIEYGGKRFRNGYGSILYRGRSRLAHRVSYCLAHALPLDESLPRETYVCHRCDNPACIRPSHLFLGDAKANSHDSSAKGRSCVGEARPESKLTEQAVRDLRAGRLTEREACEKFGVFWMVARKAKLGYTWKSVA